MNTFSHKIAVASIGIALSFALGANKGAKAATFSLTNTVEFFVTERFNVQSGLPPYTEFTNNMGSSFPVRNDRIGAFEYENRKGFYEFSISNLSLVNRAIFYIKNDDYLAPGYPPPYLEVLGYVGNGKADLSDFYAGQSLGIQRSRYPGINYNADPGINNFDVTQFVNERVRNRDGFVGFAIATPYTNRANINRTFYQPQLVIETTDAPETVPEPTTIFGSALALGVGGWLKRKKSNQHRSVESE